MTHLVGGLGKLFFPPLIVLGSASHSAPFPALYLNCLAHSYNVFSMGSISSTIKCISSVVRKGVILVGFSSKILMGFNACLCLQGAGGRPGGGDGTAPVGRPATWGRLQVTSMTTNITSSLLFCQTFYCYFFLVV